MWDDYFYYIERWNKKLHYLRMIGIILGVLMIVGAVLCIIYPLQSMRVVSYLIEGLLLVMGIFQIVDYFKTIPLFRWPGSLISAVCNIVIASLLLLSPVELTITMFAFIIAFMLMISGINKLTFAHHLSFFRAQSYGWVIFIGIVNIIAAIAFVVVPISSTVVLNYLIAGYLLVIGILLLVEMLAVKDL